MQALLDMKVWITSGGVIEQVAVATLPTAPQPMAPSNQWIQGWGLWCWTPSPRKVIPRCNHVDDMEHTLNKVFWVGTGPCDGLEDLCQCDFSFLSKSADYWSSCSGSVDGTCPNMSAVSDPSNMSVMLSLTGSVASVNQQEGLSGCCNRGWAFLSFSWLSFVLTWL